MNIFPTKRRGFLKKKSKKASPSIAIKDVVIPLFSAMVAVFLNQMFYEPNKRIEAAIEYELEVIKAQTPLINKILAFTNRYSVLVESRKSGNTEILWYSDVYGRTFRSEERPLVTTDSLSVDGNYVDNDTIGSFNVPAIVIDQEMMEQMFKDINAIRDSHEFIDPEIYLLFSDFVNFLYDNKIPYGADRREIAVSDWSNSEMYSFYFTMLDDLEFACRQKIQTFKDESRF